MNQVKKIKKLENLSYFNKATISQFVDINKNALSQDVKRWIQNGTLIPLKKGFYVTSIYFERLGNKTPYLEFISNKLREPSYLSMEYILQKYGILTESIYSINSITIKSSRIYRNNLGLFIYRNIKDELFTGFNITEKNGFSIKESTKAKALFDWLYLKLLRLKEFDLAMLESFRLNLDNFKKKDFTEFKKYCELAGIKKYLKLAEIIKKIYLQ
jgi:predicted transcriptional regulator of viral defense system